MRVSALLLILILLLTTACSRGGSSYGDAQTEKEGEAVQNSEESAEPASENAGKVQSPTATTPLAPPAQPEKPEMPSFLDQRTGEIKDMPTFPSAVRTNVTDGPMSGASTMLVVLRTRDSVEKVAAFYEKALKKNGWTIVNDTRQMDFLELKVKKGEKDEGLVKAKKDDLSGETHIALSRIEKLPKPADAQPAQPKQ